MSVLGVGSVSTRVFLELDRVFIINWRLAPCNVAVSASVNWRGFRGFPGSRQASLVEARRASCAHMVVKYAPIASNVA